jgi:hypothetical protein
LESQPENAPKARHRFGFNGKRKRASRSEHTTVSSDEILESLTRQAASQVGFGEEQTQRLELLTEVEEPTLVHQPVVSNVRPFRRDSVRRSGHFVIVLMCIAGLIVVWLYSTGRGIFNGLPFNNVLQETSVRSLFANPIQMGIISMAALATALWVALRRRASSLQIPI